MVKELYFICFDKKGEIIFGINFGLVSFILVNVFLKFNLEYLEIFVKLFENN